MADSATNMHPVRSASWVFSTVWVGLLAGNLALARSHYAGAHAVAWSFVYSGGLLISSTCLRAIASRIFTPRLSARFSRQAVVGHLFAGAHMMNFGGVCLSIWGILMLLGFARVPEDPAHVWSSTGSQRSTLTIASNDPITPTVTVQVTGQGLNLPPTIEVLPLTVQFDKVRPGSSSRKT